MKRITYYEKELINHNKPDDSPDKCPFKLEKADNYSEEEDV